MFRMLAAIATTFFALQTFAFPTTLEVLHKNQNSMIEKMIRIGEWAVGDNANYNMDMGFIQGTMTMKVRSIGAEGIWMDQDMDLGGLGQQKVETLFDPTTGEIKKLIVNGKEEEVPVVDMELVETKEASVTVPAGTFQGVYVRMKDKGNGNESESWIAEEVPLSGMVKAIQPGPLGNVTMELTSYQKN